MVRYQTRICFVKGKGSYGFLPLLLGKYGIGGMYIFEEKKCILKADLLKKNLFPPVLRIV